MAQRAQGGGDGQIGDQIGTILTDPVPSDGSSGDGSSGGDGGAVDFSKVEGSLASAAPAVEPPVAADNQVDASVEPEKAYETAYGFLLQQDYDSAERAFTSFLGQFPADKLAGNAQYWLGETHYVRGQYGPAAQAFLKGYSGFKKGPKAPDSLLKLAMSLSRLGQKEQSCASFTELEFELPGAVGSVEEAGDGRARASRLRSRWMMASTLDDFAADELAGLFKSFVPHQRIGLAISGGPDSVALLLLARCWQSLQPPPQPFLQVLTVDHRLRPASADEAGAVVALAGRLGLAAEILPWNGEKPLSGIQAAARAARYRLLAGAARCLELAAIATAHTRDDQAETLLMRLSRGSGIDGLAAMAAVGSIDGLIVLRPLLDVDKSRLVAALDAAVVPYARDPSNDDTAFERVRWRQAWPTLSALGISSDRLALSARRIGRARLALDQWTDRAVGKLGALWPEGWAQLGTDDLLELPEEIIIRVLQRLIGAVGGDPEGPGLSQLETIAGQLREVGGGGAAYTRTLARCIIRVRRYHLDILREVGRETLPAIDWDGGSPAAVGPSIRIGARDRPDNSW